jgi:hypothetical protein
MLSEEKQSASDAERIVQLAEGIDIDLEFAGGHALSDGLGEATAEHEDTVGMSQVSLASGIYFRSELHRDKCKDTLKQSIASGRKRKKHLSRAGEALSGKVFFRFRSLKNGHLKRIRKREDQTSRWIRSILSPGR